MKSLLFLKGLQQEFAHYAHHLSGETGMDIRKWGDHKVFMSSLYRRVKAVSKHAIFVCRCDWQGDPNIKPDKKSPVDEREQKLMPLLEGAFNMWFRHDVSLLAYQSKKVSGAGKITFNMLLQPSKEIMVENRLWGNEKGGLPGEIDEPTFDKLFTIIQKVGKEKE